MSRVRPRWDRAPATLSSTINAMARRGPLTVVLGLLSLLAIAGLFSDPSGLLMVAPFLGLIGMLLAGLYPGERVIEKLARIFGGRSRSAASQPGRVSVSLRFAGLLFLTAPGGSRAPPAAVLA